MPAIMKVWIDRVLISGVCYGGKRFYDQGGLVGKKAMLAITIGGQPHMMLRDGVHGGLNDMLRPILRGTLAYTGMAVPSPFVAHHVPRTTLLEQYRQHLRSLDTLQALTFVSLNQFDEKLHPISAPNTWQMLE